jgi:hypothetical protein
MRFVVPWVLLSLVGFVIFLTIWQMRWDNLIFVILLGPVMLWYVFVLHFSLKEVSCDNEFIYISDFTKEVKVPWSQIDSVSSSYLSNDLRIRIYFTEKNDFGDKILFIPKWEPYSFFTTHPVIIELRKRIGKK